MYTHCPSQDVICRFRSSTSFYSLHFLSLSSSPDQQEDYVIVCDGFRSVGVQCLLIQKKSEMHLFLQLTAVLLHNLHFIFRDNAEIDLDIVLIVLPQLKVWSVCWVMGSLSLRIFCLASSRFCWKNYFLVLVFSLEFLPGNSSAFQI